MKKQVFKFTNVDGETIVMEELDAVLEWIKADLECASVGDEFPYSIEVGEMTQEEIDSLPEMP